MEDRLIGQRFNRLTVLNRIEDYVAPTGGKHMRYRCSCECGRSVDVLAEYLTSGRQQSCGCLRRENGTITHGETGSRLYRIWGNMCNRCTNPNNPAWDRYGGRGITVCDEWKKFEGFKEWAITNGYKDDLTIDRVDNNDGYYAGNCRWANMVVQANNKRNNHLIEYNGQKKTLNEWATELDIPYKSLHRRVKLGWTVERAFNQPLRRKLDNDMPNK